MKNKKGIDTILAALLMVVIVVVASVMVYAWSTGLLGTLLVTPQVGKEALNQEITSFSTGTNVTINIRNTGTVSTQLVTYYVKDANSNQYAKTGWTGPTINPNGVNPTSFPIGASCTGCVLTGSAFTFVAGNSYTVNVVTSRNNQFSFTVTR